MERKKWLMLENNPCVMTRLATKLGLSPELQFYDVYTLDEPELLAHIPRPVLALLVTIPLTPAWDRDREAEDAEQNHYTGFGPEEPVIWFKQTIGNACGSIGVLHSTINGPAADFIEPDSDLAEIRRRAISLQVTERANMLYNSKPFELAHKSVEEAGDTPAIPVAGSTGHHFVAFVKAKGKLWELEGSRKGPLERGSLADNEDVLSLRALEMGLKRIIGLKRDEGGDIRFSCIALARKS
ncbi:ubiquitin carboxyl-terminal hydrolase [Delitschia confertaspora ATCC 74209]|uniref:Ubiquitin carboxyl-terminal hydrolase n=1 Tax=Delitschia confertaspora ATCC 74209 TaxID=1513339 RepID=A0A9P4JKA4_9PLEO|nr:ubiquitin carboxyl-terminal hydrolase [Delitschia confertaspora ATCC 74209]